MNKYRVTLYPNNSSDEYDVEAESVDEAIEQAEEMASRNSFFTATKDDVELLADEDDKDVCSECGSLDIKYVMFELDDRTTLQERKVCNECDYQEAQK